jgi:hypothetical protein
MCLFAQCSTTEAARIDHLNARRFICFPASGELMLIRAAVGKS